MKQKTHPQWYPQAKVSCACGHSFTVGSTAPEIQVEICAACHPFFTGEMKFIDTMGRVEKFQKRQKAAKKTQSKRKAKAKEKQRKARQPRTLKEMLKQPTKKTA